MCRRCSCTASRPPENTNVTIVVRPIACSRCTIGTFRLVCCATVRRDRMLADPFGLLISLFETAASGDTLRNSFGLKHRAGLRRIGYRRKCSTLAPRGPNGKVRLCLMDARRDLTCLLRNAVVRTRANETHAKRLRNLIGTSMPCCRNNFLFESELPASSRQVHQHRTEPDHQDLSVAAGMMPPADQHLWHELHVMPELAGRSAIRSPSAR
jgi:hypothetical protein